MTNDMQISDQNSYVILINELKTQITQARIRAHFAVNKELIMLYWNIGNKILDKQKIEGWGAKVIENISKDLQVAFPEMTGFSSTNLKYMRLLASRIQYNEISPQLVDQMPWGHLRCLLDAFQETQQLFWYIQKTIENGWSRNVLSLQIKTDLYARDGKSITNFKDTLPQIQSDLAQSIIKDPYNLEFLNIKEKVVERDLENKLISHLKDFLLELGQGFAFVGNQYHIELEGEDYYIDLVFYHIKLKCYFIIELKTGKFKPEYAGKLNFYLNLMDNHVKEESDNKTIGLILCEEKRSITVEYAIQGITRPIGVSEFRLTEKLPSELQKYLPTIAILEKELSKEIMDDSDEVNLTKEA